MSEYDCPWKEALDLYFQAFLAFFFPDIFAQIDWTRDCEALDQELRKLAPEGEVGPRRVDKLVQVWSRDTGDPVYLHVEVQSQQEVDFARRIYVYNYRIEDRYNQPTVSLVVFGDESPTWKPTEYVFERWGCRRTFEFPGRKLLEYAGRDAELEADPNPFAWLVLCHLQAQATRGDVEARREWKLRLLRGLAGRGLDADDLRQRYRFLDWLLDLPSAVDDLVWAEMDRIAKEKQMPFVTTAERIGMKKGMEQGLQEGRQEGLQQGLQEGFLTGIAALLEVKFGGDGVALLPTIQQVTDVTVLKQILDTARTAATLEDVRRLVP